MRYPGRWGSRDERQEAGGQAEWAGHVQWIGQVEQAD